MVERFDSHASPSNGLQGKRCKFEDWEKKCVEKIERENKRCNQNQELQTVNIGHVDESDRLLLAIAANGTIVHHVIVEC